MAKRQKKSAKRSAPGTATKEDLIQKNPIRAAIGKVQIEQYFRHIRLGMFGIANGSDATRLLSHIGWVVGLAAETERFTRGITQNLRLLHGACRNVQMLCMRGYTWDDQFALSFENAVSLARATLDDRPHIAAQLIHGANYFQQRIQNHAVDESDISGADVYQEAA